MLKFFAPSLIALTALAVAPIAAPAQDVNKPTAADIEAIETLAKEVLGQVDAAKSARAARAKVQDEIRRARIDVSNAEKTVTVARISVAEYLDTSFPQDEQTAHGEIKLAESEMARARDRLKWSDRMVKRGVISEAENLADKMDAQKAEIELQNAKMKLQVLVSYTKKKQIMELESGAKKAEADLLALQATVAESDAILARAERRVAETDLTEAEAGVLVTLDQAIAQFDAGQPVKAREQIAAATKVWREAQSARAVARFPSLKKTIRDEVKTLKAAKQQRKVDQPAAAPKRQF